MAIGIKQAGGSSFRFQPCLGLGHQKAVAVQDVGWQNVTPGRETYIGLRVYGASAEESTWCKIITLELMLNAHQLATRRFLWNNSDDSGHCSLVET